MWCKVGTILFVARLEPDMSALVYVLGGDSELKVFVY